MMNILENSPRDIESISEEKITFIEEDILNFKGPSLEEISFSTDYVSKIHDCSTFELLKKYSHNTQYEVRFVGRGNEAQNKAFCYVLMEIGMRQRKFYPHLNTLIKQQFYRPQMFIQFSEEEQLQIHRTCQIYFSQIRVGSKVEEFLNQNKVMLDACLHILRKISIIHFPSQISNDNIISLSRKFNIDCEPASIQNEEPQVYNLGVKGKVHIFKEKDLFFVAFDINKKYENSGELQQFMESERELSDKNNHLVSQLSEQNTPKFKENLESILNQRKSHKNSFGGDFEVMNYKQLVSTLKKKYSDKLDLNKVFSEKFEDKQAALNNLDEEKIVNKLMRGSHIEGKNYQNNEQQYNGPLLMASQIFNAKKRQLAVQKNKNEINPKLSFSKNDAHKFIIQEDCGSQLNQSISNFVKKQVSPIEIADPITEIESSQKQKTQKSSEIQKQDLSVDEFLTFSEKSKIKNRKFSYLAQNRKYDLSEKNMKKSFDVIPEIDSPKKQTPTFKKKQQKSLKFEENPICFSQMMNNDESQHSGKSIFRQSQRRSITKNNLTHQSNILSFVKESVNVQPQDWIAKQSTYFFKDKPPQKYITQRKYSVVNPSIFQKIEAGNIRSTIDTHCVSSKSNMKSTKINKKQMSETSIQNPQKKFSQSPKERNISNWNQQTNLAKEKSLTSIQVPDPSTSMVKKDNKIKVNFNYISSQQPKNLTNVYSARDLKPFTNQDRPIRFAFSPKASIKTFW